MLHFRVSVSPVFYGLEGRNLKISPQVAQSGLGCLWVRSEDIDQPEIAVTRDLKVLPSYQGTTIEIMNALYRVVGDNRLDRSIIFMFMVDFKIFGLSTKLAEK